jgi:transcriptional regulator with XRE-family HTH domain
MDFGKRLDKLLIRLKLSKRSFAEKVGISSGSLSQWSNPKYNSKPSFDVLVNISKHFNVNINWLLTGKGSMFNGNDPPEDSNRISELEKECEKLRAEISALEAENKEINKELRERFKQLMGLHEAALKGQC